YGLGLVAMLAVAGCIHAGWKTVWLVPVVAAGWLMEIQLIKPIGVQVAAVQAEMAPLQRYIELTKQASYSARLIVWPEYAVPRDMRATNDISQMQQAADNARSIIVFGTQTRLGGAKWQNTALTVNRDGILGEHGKNHTVHLFDDGERGTTQGVIETSVGKIGTPICFDCDFHDVARRMTLNGAEFFAVPSMDAASWGEKQHLQHSQLFRVRAAENRRAFVVAASSGISQIISPTGRTTASLPPMQQGVVEGLIIPNKQLTHFTRWGWLTPWLALGALAAWSFYLGAARSLISTR
ncbi:MAG: hypothetical protein JNG86_01225, partial [Verrucomicrobiaceae bacterium]|nr:hypothetical protein [Verrucomicrobiaceae bacterium]